MAYKPTKIELATLFIGTVAAIAAGVQAWISASQQLPLPQVSAKSLEQLQKQLESRRDNLLEEAKTLDALISDLKNATIDSSRTPNRVIADTQPSSKDPWWISSLKVFVVYVMIGFGLAFFLLPLIGDLIGLLFGFDFVLVGYLWEFAWTKVTVEWYWNSATIGGAATSIVVLIVAVALFGYFNERRDRGDPASA